MGAMHPEGFSESPPEQRLTHSPTTSNSMSIQPTKQEVHPSGRIIEFYESDHRYCIRDEPEIEFTSATTWISRFFPEFDRENVSRNYAIKNNMRQEDVLAKWDEKSRMARERGTLIHQKAERAILHFQENGEHIALEESLTPVENDGVSNDPSHTKALIGSMHEAVIRMSEVLDFLQAERVIASPDLRLSGMVDLVVQLRSDKGRPLIGLYDWKTNARIEQDNRWQTGRPPISHLSHCNFNHYSLQLNLYEYICRREGYFPDNADFQKALIHLEADGYKTYKCPDMQEVIRLMLASDKERSA
jgi:hypothetical protein